jgi:hypothetical protein
MAFLVFGVWNSMAAGQGILWELVLVCMAVGVGVPIVFVRRFRMPVQRTRTGPRDTP